jgi:hypothetical protein
MARFNKVGDAVRESLSNLFDGGVQSPAQKKHNGSGCSGGTDAQSKRTASPSRRPFDDAQCGWLQKALEKTFTDFGSAVDARFQEHEKKLNHQHAELEDLKSKVQELASRQDIADNLEARIEAVEEKAAKALETRPDASLGPSGLPPAASASATFEQKSCTGTP